MIDARELKRYGLTPEVLDAGKRVVAIAPKRGSVQMVARIYIAMETAKTSPPGAHFSDWILRKNIAREGRSIPAGNMPAKFLWLRLACLGALDRWVKASHDELLDGLVLSRRALGLALTDLRDAGLLEWRGTHRQPREFRIYQQEPR